MAQVRSVLLAATLAAAPLSATSAAGFYLAEPAAAPLSDRIITRAAVWNRNGAGFVAGKGNSRHQVVCQAFAAEVGALRSFAIAGTPISDADLEKCNAKARS